MKGLALANVNQPFSFWFWDLKRLSAGSYGTIISLQVLSGLGIYSGENEQFGEELRRPKELMIAERFLGERRRIVGIGLEMASLSIDKEETGNKGRMWALQQQLDPPMDEEGGRLRNRYDEKVYNIILYSRNIVFIAHSISFFQDSSTLFLLQLAFQSLGVVYGDLGTSPLYVFYNTFPDGIKDPEDVIGALSLIIYSITLVPLLKYVFIVCRANDNGQGGTFALYSLLCRHAKVKTIPNQDHSDEKLTTYSHSTYHEKSFAAKTKRWLESHTFRKNSLLVLVLVAPAWRFCSDCILYFLLYRNCSGCCHYNINSFVLGDFNATMNPTDSKGGDPNWSRHKQAFGDCMHQAELHTVPYRGIKYTWHNRQQGEDTILKKLDWVIGNTAMANVWPNATAHFFPRSVSDHSSMMLQLRQDQFKPKPSFKFLNFWVEREDFIPQIARVWQVHIHGSPMFRFTSKLQLIKAHLRNWHKVNRSNISIRVAKAKADWDEAQVRLDADPLAEETILLERNKAKLYLRLSKDEEAFFKQRSRIQWLTLGDRNTTFFHRSLLHRNMRNKITCLEDGEGNIFHDQEGLGKVAVGYYRHLMNEETGTGAGMQDYGERNYRIFQRQKKPAGVLLVPGVASFLHGPVACMAKGPFHGPWSLRTITGTEALFADLSHFSVPSIQIAFTVVVFPCLLSAYSGQGAYLLQNSDNVADTFYRSIPGLFRPSAWLCTRSYCRLLLNRKLLESMMEGCSDLDEHSLDDELTRELRNGLSGYDGDELSSIVDETISSAGSMTVNSELQANNTILQSNQMISEITNGELQRLRNCRDAGVVHILGNTVVTARQDSSLWKKIAIDYVYALLRKLCRENTVSSSCFQDSDFTSANFAGDIYHPADSIYWPVVLVAAAAAAVASQATISAFQATHTHTHTHSRH
ncbi:hypothetical protein SADUNF_Sadunf03G0079300 [Salix dunnii]|uniref:K+ potassium transporter integral membrane domain-containing protein n=1 Tax=Salix dunnii TaxID=1413687 RepID=A0A835KEJ7_9ROSI|nr:hypothetical protein SADUNF_Sadunf03G0079300 [Salix dunnii]